MTDEMSYLVGERDKHYSAYHKTSVDWGGATTAVLLQPSASTSYLVSRIGFTSMDPAVDFAQTIKMDYYDGANWETRFLANNYASLANVADRVDSWKAGTKDMITFFWHYRNGIILRGTRGEQLKIYPSALITGCDYFYCGVRYFEFV
jgi:hypothetical protein